MSIDNPELISRVVEQSSEGIAISDLKGNLLFVNRAFASMHGYKPDELIGQHLSIFHSAKQLPAVKAANRKMLDRGEFIGDIWHIRKDGTEFATTMHNSLLRDESGKPIGMIGTLNDITEQKEAEANLLKQLKRFNDVADNAREWIWEVDGEGKYTYASPAVEEILGYQPGEILGNTFYNFFHSQDSVHLKKTALKFFKDKKPFRNFINRNVHKDGRTIWLSTSGVPIIEDGELIGYRGVDIDITDHKQADQELEQYRRRLEEMVEKRTAELKSSNIKLRKTIKEQRKTQAALEESERRWLSLWENIPDIVLSISRKGEILSLNRNVSGYPTEEVLRSSIYKYIASHDVERVKKIIARVFRTGKPAIYEVQGAGYEGPEAGWYETQAVPIKSDGRTQMVTLICTDITPRKKALAALKKSEKELKEQKKALEEKNIALREVLEQLEIEKKQIRGNMAASVEKLVLPALHKIRKVGTLPSAQTLDILERNLKKLTSAFDLGFSDPRLKLTPREIEICELIQSGLPNKEISRVLNLSRATVEKHRENIRKKFGISGKKINLRSFLHNM